MEWQPQQRGEGLSRRRGRRCGENGRPFEKLVYKKEEREREIDGEELC